MKISPSVWGILGDETGDWLRQKRPEDKKLLFEAALRLPPGHKALFRQRQAAIKKFILQAQTSKQAKLVDKDAKRLVEKEKLSSIIGEAGFWSSGDMVVSNLATVAAKLSALKSQIKYRQVVLQQKAERKELFQWSSGGKAFSWQDLVGHLLELINSASIQ